MAEIPPHWQAGPLLVVTNDSGAYSIWPAGRALPAGWTAGGFSGPRAECLDYIARRWTSLAPAGLREHPPAPYRAAPAGVPPLVDRLIHGAHAVRASGMSGYVHVTLADVPGEPAIGLLVQPGTGAAGGEAVFEGACLLDGTPLIARVALDPRSLSGTATFSR